MQESPYVGGNFNNSANAGLRYWNLSNSPGNANINIGARHILAKLRKNYRTILSIPLGKNKVVTEGFSRLILEKPLDAKEKEVITIKRIGHLYDKIVDRENIKQAIINASRNKRNRKRVQKILDNIDHCTLEIQRMLEDETYTPSSYIEEKIKDRREIKSYLNTIGLEIKDDWQVYRLDKRPLDFLGFRFYRTHITMRKRNALRIKRRAKKIYKKGKLNYKDSAAMLSYLGWLKHSNSYNYYLKNIKPYVDINEMKEVVRNESRKRNNTT